MDEQSHFPLPSRVHWFAPWAWSRTGKIGLAVYSCVFFVLIWSIVILAMIIEYGPPWFLTNMECLQDLSFDSACPRAGVDLC